VSQRNSFLAGVAQLLAVETDPTLGIDWEPTGAYAAGKTGIYVEVVPATPDRIVTLATYDLGDDAMYADSLVGLQIRTRAGQDPRDVLDLDEACSAVLNGRWPDTMGGIQVQTITRTSGVMLGQDDNLRWSRTSNFTCSLHLPATHRL
jgi:hypothetical protein